MYRASGLGLPALRFTLNDICKGKKPWRNHRLYADSLNDMSSKLYIKCGSQPEESFKYLFLKNWHGIQIINYNWLFLACLFMMFVKEIYETNSLPSKIYRLVYSLTKDVNRPILQLPEYNARFMAWSEYKRNLIIQKRWKWCSQQNLLPKYRCPSESYLTTETLW